MKYLCLLAVLIGIAIPAATQDEDSFNKTYRTYTLMNCNWWNLWTPNSQTDLATLGYIVGFNDGANLASAVTDNDATYFKIFPPALQFAEIQNRVNYECSKGANAKVPIATLIRKIHDDIKAKGEDAQ